MAYRIVLRNGRYVPQWGENGRWVDAPLTYATIGDARTVAVAGRPGSVPDQVVEEG